MQKHDYPKTLFKTAELTAGHQVDSMRIDETEVSVMFSAFRKHEDPHQTLYHFECLKEMVQPFGVNLHTEEKQRRRKALLDLFWVLQGQKQFSDLFGLAMQVVNRRKSDEDAYTRKGCIVYAPSGTGKSYLCEMFTGFHVPFRGFEESKWWYPLVDGDKYCRFPNSDNWLSEPEIMATVNSDNAARMRELADKNRCIVFSSNPASADIIWWPNFDDHIANLEARKRKLVEEKGVLSPVEEKLTSPGFIRDRDWVTSVAPSDALWFHERCNAKGMLRVMFLAAWVCGFRNEGGGYHHSSYSEVLKGKGVKVD